VPPRVPQAGGIVFRKEGDRLSVLLVRSKKDPTVWVFPKGHIESGESPATTAVRETFEESGVTGDVAGPVGAPLEFRSGREIVSVQYFLIRAQTEGASPERRDKQWLSIDEALKALAFESAREKLREAQAGMT
jgi:8-oxo-dGTP pyrophosphatase MutT (NUDIX family)